MSEDNSDITEIITGKSMDSTIPRDFLGDTENSFPMPIFDQSLFDIEEPAPTPTLVEEDLEGVRKIQEVEDLKGGVIQKALMVMNYMIAIPVGMFIGLLFALIPTMITYSPKYFKLALSLVLILIYIILLLLGYVLIREVIAKSIKV